jgi:hypothetical protein
VQLLVLLLMTAGLVWLSRRAGVTLSDRVLVVLVRGFTGWRGSGPAWPRGVQEEDRDRPWGRPPAQPAERPLPKPALSRVQPVVHAR